MDKRIIKTKNNIKRTLIKMLAETPFEDITVKELCERAETSRITFYTHYSDKNELAYDIFGDMSNIAIDEYHRLQNENNPNKEIVLDYMNILYCVLNTFECNYDFFSHTLQSESPALNYMYSKLIDELVGQKIEKDRERLNPRYSLTMTRDFICSGLRGFIAAGRAEGMPADELRNSACELLRRLLENEVLRK